ncbi:MAG TPA: hypothetical protein VFP58_13110 [Candidatus Eisenbacteria bacterium]|nr:hypothetical protein [Candidatus Eisenbacteria bacterium]
MYRVRSKLVQLLITLAVTFTFTSFSTCVTPARAQSIWIPRDKDRGILLEALHPSIEGIDPEFPTGALYLGARIGLGETWALVAELPYAHSEPFIGGGIFLGNFPSSSTIGNPYLGAEVRVSPDLFVELGARPPLTDDDEGTATLFGASADPSRRLAFAQGTLPVFGYPFAYDAITAQTLFNIRHVTPGGLVARVRLGPALVLATEGGRDTEVYALYAVQMAYEGRSVRAGGAFSGWSFVSEDQGNLGQRTATQLELHADFGPWTVRPGVDLKMPIGSAAGLVPVILGIAVGASF